VPRYYFNVYNDDVTMDPEGAERADGHAARACAVKAVRSLAAETVLHGHFAAHHRVEVVDENRKLIDTVRFDEGVEIRP
jgi:hypothetical protein